MNFARLKNETTMLVLAFGLSSMFFLVRCGSWGVLSWKVWRLEKIRKAIVPLASESGFQHEESLQGTLSFEAKAAGVGRLLNVGTLSRGRETRLDLEWESSPKAFVQFLNNLQGHGRVGECEQLHISMGEGRLVHVGGSFSPGIGNPSPARGVQPPLSFARNVFLPLWESKPEDPGLAQVREIKKQDEIKKQEQEKAEADQRKRQEEADLQNKRHQLETELTLTGIVNNGHEPLAFVSSRGGGQTFMLHNGDVVQEARITAINEQRGEIQLDYQGKFQVNLKISRNSGNVQ